MRSSLVKFPLKVYVPLTMMLYLGARPELPSYVGPKSFIALLLKECWKADPLKRPSFEAIVEAFYGVADIDTSLLFINM